MWVTELSNNSLVADSSRSMVMDNSTQLQGNTSTPQVIEELRTTTDSLLLIPGSGNPEDISDHMPSNNHPHLDFGPYDVSVDDFWNFSKPITDKNVTNSNATAGNALEFTRTEYQWIMFFSSIIALLGVVFNCLSIMVFTKGRRSSRRDIRILIINLCVADLLLSLTGPVPMAINTNINIDFPNNDFLCKIWRVLFIIAVDMSPMANLAIAIERTMVVFSPARTLRLWNRKRTMYIIIVLFWLITIVVDIEYLYRPTVTNGYCSSNTALAMEHREVFPYYLLAKFVVPTIILVTLYIIIGAKLLCFQPVGVNSMDKDQRRAIRARNKLVRMLFIVAAVTFVSWTPSNIETLVTLMWKELTWTKGLFWMSNILFLLQLTNGFTTPIIYFLFDEHFKKDLDEIMCCTRQKKNAKRRKRRAKQHNSRSRIAGEDISAAEPSTTSTTTVIDSGV